MFARSVYFIYIICIVPVFEFRNLFTYYNLLERPKFIGFDNYMKLFCKIIFILSLKHINLSRCYWARSYIMAFVLVSTNELPRHLKSIMTLIFYAPSISGNALMVDYFLKDAMDI